MADILASITEGTKLHAIYSADGVYYPAVVKAVSTAKSKSKKPVKVAFTGYDTEVWVALKDLKSKKLGLKPKEAAAPKAKTKAKANAKKDEKKPDFSELTKGLRLQGKADDGKYYAAEVVAVSNKKEQVKIHWVGYTSASDEWVGADRIRSKHLKFISPKAKVALNKKNSAFVFIKPHAVTDKTKALAKAGLEKHGIKILKEGTIKGEVIDKKKLIDQHYYAIASKATILKPDALNVPNDKFKAQFGMDWKDCLASGKAVNAMDACAKLGLDADGLDAEWAKCKADKKLVKLGGGFYCGLVKDLYVFNGFFMSMRSKFTKPGTQIYYYTVEWDASALSWEDFRGKVLGPTDPADAPADSLRGQILAKWEELGLKSKPDTGDNGMHASASPFEALSERNNWLGIPIYKDRFGRLVLSEDVPMKTIKEWSVDPQVNIEKDKKGSIFDALEDMNADPCLAKLVALSAMN